MNRGILLQGTITVRTLFVVGASLWLVSTPASLHASTLDKQAPPLPFETLENESALWKTTPEAPSLEAQTNQHNVPDVELPPVPQAEQDIAQPDSLTTTSHPQHDDKDLTAQEESLQTLAHEILPPQMPESWKPVEQLPAEDEGRGTIDEASWISPEAIEKDTFYKADISTSDKNAGTHIRFSFLPDPCFQAVDDVKITKPKPITPRPEPELTEKKAEPQEPQKKKDDSCIAFSKARQRQLDALESDRQTLIALRNAMKDLGLTNQLSFMADDATTIPEQAAKTVKQTEKDPPIHQ